MQDQRMPGGRALIGKILIASAGLMGALALAIWFGWLPVGGDLKGYIAAAVLVAAIADALIGLRFLAEGEA